MRPFTIWQTTFILPGEKEDMPPALPFGGATSLHGLIEITSNRGTTGVVCDRDAPLANARAPAINMKSASVR
jgi:hypothetical protein